jgi:hypothetical protein
MKLRLILALTVLAFAASAAVAHASTDVTRLGDQAGLTKPEVCRVVKHADHSVTVHCPVGQSVTLQWNFLNSVTAASVNCLSYGGCRNAPTITAWRHVGIAGPRTGYTVAIVVHANTVASMTATIN